jgi:hypothetical protein
MKTKEAIVALTYAIQQLDTASGELYNALDNTAKLYKAHLLPSSLQKQIDKLDITLIDSIKNQLTELLEGDEA